MCANGPYDSTAPTPEIVILNVAQRSEECFGLSAACYKTSLSGRESVDSVLKGHGFSHAIWCGKERGFSP